MAAHNTLICIETHITGSIVVSVHCVDPEAQVESLVGGHCWSHVGNTVVVTRRREILIMLTTHHLICITN